MLCWYYGVNQYRAFTGRYHYDLLLIFLICAIWSNLYCTMFKLKQLVWIHRNRFKFLSGWRCFQWMLMLDWNCVQFCHFFRLTDWVRLPCITRCANPPKKQTVSNKHENRDTLLTFSFGQSAGVGVNQSQLKMLQREQRSEVRPTSHPNTCLTINCKLSLSSLVLCYL